jgi:hypothetical protein
MAGFIGPAINRAPAAYCRSPEESDPNRRFCAVGVKCGLNGKDNFMRAWVKAGVIGGIIQILLTIPTPVIYLLPADAGSIVSLCICLPFFFSYPVVGILAAHWLTPPRDTRQGAIAGSQAGLLAAGIDSVATGMLTIIIALLGLPQRYLDQLTPEMLEAVQRSGMESMFTTGGQIVTTLCSLPIHALLGVVFGCVGGLIYAAVKKD